MKPAWDKLEAAYKDHPTTLIADVDCTTDGKPLCTTHGVRGFPTIKYGDPANLETYEGGRDFAALEKFAKGLKPGCSPKNIDLCEPDQKAKLEEFMKMSDADLDAAVAKGDEDIAAAEKFFTDEVDKLQKQYTGLSEDKEKKLEEIKNSGVGLMKAVKANADKGTKSEL
jgi:hypothetical protein